MAGMPKTAERVAEIRADKDSQETRRQIAMSGLPTLDVQEFDPYTDTIVIEGVKFSGKFFRGYAGTG